MMLKIAYGLIASSFTGLSQVHEIWSLLWLKSVET